jgi:hypothetical protein
MRQVAGVVGSAAAGEALREVSPEINAVFAELARRLELSEGCASWGDVDAYLRALEGEYGAGLRRVQLDAAAELDAVAARSPGYRVVK